MGSSSSRTTSSSCSNSSCSASRSPPEKKLNSNVPSSTTVQRAFSFPMPLIHHPPVKKGDTHHLVSLTSTTYGSLLHVDLDVQTLPHISVPGKNTAMTDESGDSVSPDSVINTWELMNDLEDEFGSTKPDVDVNGSHEFVRMEEEEEEDWVPLPSKPKQPLWKHMAEESFLSGLDSNLISSYKRALSSRQLGKNTKPVSCIHSDQSVVSSSPLSPQTLEEQEKPRLLETEETNKNKIVLYFTSLRGIRKTYEDCCYVRTVLRGFQVAVEERDISMDSEYRKEVQILLGEEKPVCLPQVFIRGVHVGGVEEIKRLNDGGELGEMLRGFPVCESVGACDCCGDARFVPCGSCGGSTKVFEEQEDGFKRCNGCNENGLVRCNKCCL
ncbi:F132 [Hirschfeldia incana]|nr:F132 [Hirschfeldia incana]